MRIFDCVYANRPHQSTNIQATFKTQPLIKEFPTKRAKTIKTKECYLTGPPTKGVKPNFGGIYHFSGRQQQTHQINFRLPEGKIYFCQICPVFRNKIITTLMQISSPFVDEVKECKQSMRKLRKKIYKHSVGSKGRQSRKSKDSTDEIMHIFRERNIPPFVTEILKKRRSFDMSSIKNIAVTAALPLADIQNRTNAQESEINQLYVVHKERMLDLKARAQTHRPDKQSSSMEMGHPRMHSSTEEQVLSEWGQLESPEVQFCEPFDSPSGLQGEELFTDHYLQMNDASSPLDPELLFL